MDLILLVGDDGDPKAGRRPALAKPGRAVLSGAGNSSRPPLAPTPAMTVTAPSPADRRGPAARRAAHTASPVPPGPLLPAGHAKPQPSTALIRPADL